jgi:ABC-type transport system substrate-binding protein
MVPALANGAIDVAVQAEPSAAQAVNSGAAVKWRELAETNADHEVRGPFAKGQLGYSADDAFPEFDLAKASQLAKDYEKKHGHPIEAEVLTTGNIDDQAQMQLLIEQWGKAGIKVTIKTAELAGLVAAVVLGGYQLAGWRNFGSLDPDGDYLWWHSSAIQATPKISTNVARYKDAEIDKALDEARGTTDAATRQKDFEIVERKLNEGVAYVWLGRPTWVIAANPQLQGLGALANGSGATIASKTWLATLWITH